MRVQPTIQEVVRGKRGMLSGINLLLEHQCLVSAVTLMFSAIDALSALSRPVEQKYTDRDVFIHWVERYLLPDSILGCTALELYAARCGVLHAYSPGSQLHDQGSARQLIYEWREGPSAETLAPLPPGSLVVELEALHAALEHAIQDFLHDAELDSEVSHRVQAHLPSLLCYSPWPRLAVRVA